MIDPICTTVEKATLCFRMFGTKCEKCGSCFRKNDFVMRAKCKIYHMECFRCIACERQLVPGKLTWLSKFIRNMAATQYVGSSSTDLLYFLYFPGDEFALREDGLFCR